MRLATVLFFGCILARGQEAQSPFQIEGTFTAEANYSAQLSSWPRNGSPWTGGGRLVLYPKWRIGGHWSFLASVQLRSRPFYFQDFDTQGYGLNADILQAQMVYSRIARGKSLSLRAGQMSSAFGSFLLRYDDSRNALIDMPISYGYYQGVTTFGLMGAEADASLQRFDFRAQFTNSSPANRRGIFDSGQFGDWAGGVGYTIRQGVRVGFSGYRGPYLDHGFVYYFPGEAPPRTLPATGYSIEAEAAHGHWNFYSEIQKFQYAYHVIPTFTERVWYAEAKRTLSPRWYAALRVNRLAGDRDTKETVYELALGFRPNRLQLLKIGYERQNSASTPGALGNIFAAQLVTTISPIAVGRK